MSFSSPPPPPDPSQVDYDEMQRARKHADAIVLKRAAQNNAREEMEEEAEKKSKEKGEGMANLNEPLWKIWNILRPTWKTLFSTEFEALSMLVITLTKVVELKLQTEVVRALDRTLSSRSLVDFKAGMIKGTLVACGGSMLRIIYSYQQARLTWKWRLKLTELFHKKYFSGFNYYWLGAGGGRGLDKIEDPDSRITQDLNATIGGFANYFSSSMNSVVTGVLQTRELWVNFGPLFAVAPYIYLAVSFFIVEKVMPMRKSWRRMGHARGFSWGKYCYAAQRLEQQQEAIAALKGGDREGNIIDVEYVVHLRDCTHQHWAFWKFGIVNNFFMDNATEAFVSIFCIGRGIWFPTYDSNDTIDKIADTRSEVAVQWLLFTQTMSSARTAITLLRDMQQLIGNVERITEMMDTLDRVAEAKENEKKAQTVEADMIAFDNVTVITPAGVKLVQNLSFKLERGQSLLLVGHNGSGKSSIFRCLGGLWKIPEGGIITKPKTEEFFYIPQKPYNVRGKLADQLTYPMQATDVADGQDEDGNLVRKDLVKHPDRLKEILQEVDLEYLMARPDALTGDQDWGSILSLGEKQRMQIARLIYHEPKYAILDECSSAISTEMEQRLYRIVAEKKITYITIAHRPTLRAYHDRILAIGDGELGFTMEEIDKAQMAAKVSAMAKASKVSDDEEARIRAFKAERDKPFSTLQKVKELPDKSTLSRAWRLWVLSKPNQATLKILGICGLIGVSTFISQITFANTGEMFACLMNQDKKKFNRLIVISLVAAAAQGFVKESMVLIQREMGIAMGMKVERNLTKRLVRDNTFYYMTNIDRRIKDIAHRVVSDCNQFFHVIGTILISGINPLVQVVFFTYKLWQLAGWQYPVALVCYYFVSLQIVRLAMPDYTWLYKEASRLDAEFLHFHHRVKTCAEQIAFFDGGQREREIVEMAHKKLMAHDWKRNWMNFKLNIVQDIVQSRIPEVFQWTLRFGFGYLYGGSDEEVLADNGASLNRDQTYLMAVLPQIAGNLGQAIALADRFAQVAGQIVRVAEFQEVLDEIEQQREIDANKSVKDVSTQSSATGDYHGGKYVPVTEEKIVFKDVSVVTPAGECITHSLTAEITKNNALMLTGRSAAGKSSIVRCIAGLWPISAGVLEVYNTTGTALPALSDVFVVPQNLLMATGSLADQVHTTSRLFLCRCVLLEAIYADAT